MLETSTLSLLLSMTGFILVAVIVVHHHNCSDQIQRARYEVKRMTSRLKSQADIFEQQVIDLQIQIDEVDEQIRALEHRGPV